MFFLDIIADNEAPRTMKPRSLQESSTKQTTHDRQIGIFTSSPEIFSAGVIMI